MKNACSTESGCCESTQGSAAQTSQDCCEGSSCACPLEQMTSLWKSSFGHALRQVYVEALKSRIQKAWGEKINQSADAVVDAMGTQWAAKMAAGKAEMDLKEKLGKIVTEGKK